MSALILRIIACLAMLLDHIGYYSNNMILRAFGRIAFPIFVYLIYNGYRHTSCRWRYALRLAVFAVISQIPFSLFLSNTVNYPNGNVFMTLLVALLCVWGTDWLLHNKVGRWVCWVPALAGFLLYELGPLRSDYGSRGIILAMVFYLFDGKAVWKRLLVILACLLSLFYKPLIHFALSAFRSFPAIDKWDMWQLFSLCALPFIFLYNGKKGPTLQNKWAAKAMQLGFYLFYPVHMLILWLLHFL